SISRSVGRNGANLRKDIETVQKLLNLVAVDQGGAAPPFFTLGAFNQQLVSAIERFQRRHFTWMPDGRIDPDGPTIQKLVKLGGPAPAPTPLPSGGGIVPPSYSYMDKALSDTLYASYQDKTSDKINLAWGMGFPPGAKTKAEMSFEQALDALKRTANSLAVIEAIYNRASAAGVWPFITFIRH